MKRITKRMLALFLAMLMLFGSAVSVWGTENKEAEPSQAKIRVKTPDSDYKLNVYVLGDEFLFSMEDLAVLTGYTYEYNDDGGLYDLFYTRGSKTLELYLDVNQMFPVLEGNAVKQVAFDTPPMMIGGTWYLPGSEILPWMNVFCFEDDGVFYIKPDAVSYYDIVDDFDCDLFDFDFYDACEAINISGNNLRVTTFFKRQGISGTLKHGMSVDDDPFQSYGSYETFYEVLEIFMADRNAAVEAAEMYKESGEALDKNVGFWETLFECTDAPKDAEFLGKIGKSLKVIEMGMEIARFYSIYNQDNDLKLGIMEKIWNGRYDDIHYDNTVRAAKGIITAYTNFWAGLLLTTGNFLEDEILDELVEKAVGYLTGTEILMLTLDVVDMASDVTMSWDEAIDNIRIYEYLIPSARKYYEEVYDGYDYSAYAMEDRLGNAMLYLHSQEMSYRGMAQYMDEKRRGGGGLLTEYEEQAYKAQQWQGKFLAAYQSCLNDSTDRNSFGQDGISRVEYSKYLKDEFKKTDKMKSAPMELAYIEYAFVLQGLKDTVGYDDYKWLIMDVDKDGGKELVVGLDFQTSGYPAQAIFDAGSITTWYHQRRGASGMSMYVAAADGSTVYLNDGGNSTDYIVDNYYRWNGVTWEIVGLLELEGVDSGGEYTFEHGGMMNQYKGEIKWDGEPMSMDAYYEKAASETAELTYSCPDLSDFTIRGDSQTLLKEIENYMKGRSNYGTSAYADINLDGDEDLLVAINDAYQYWFGYIESDTGCFENFADYEARYLTILAAETVPEGVRIRFVNRPISELQGIDRLEKYKLEGTTLTIGNLVLNYNESGKVYTKEGDSWYDYFEDTQEEYTGPMDDIGIDDYPDQSILNDDLPEEEAVTLLDLVFMDKKGVRRCLDDYQEQGSGQDKGSLYGTPVTIQYDEYETVSSITAENTAGYAQITGAFPLDSKLGELWYMIPSVSDWSDPMATEGGYTTAFVYQEVSTGLEAYCELTFDGIEQDSNVVMIYIQWKS